MSAGAGLVSMAMIRDQYRRKGDGPKRKETGAMHEEDAASEDDEEKHERTDGEDEEKKGRTDGEDNERKRRTDGADKGRRTRLGLNMFGEDG